jgi:hypothetical protein
MLIIFRNSFKDYSKLKRIFDFNKIGDYLFDNEIEKFLKLVQEKKIK